MRAIRVYLTGDPSVLRLEEVDTPTPERGEVLVRLHAIGVNPVETYLRSGQQGYSPRLPYTPGSDGAGIVEGVGAGVGGWQVGDRVYLSGAKTGTYAEYALCTPDQIHALPEALSFAQGAALGVPYATAYRALFSRARIATGETVLVHGATGGVGLAAVQLARAHGCQVFGTGGTDAGRALLREQGVEAAFDHHAEGYMEKAKAATGGRGFEVIVEMLANVNLERDLEALAPHGRVVVVGSRGRIEITPRLLMGRDADVRGMSLRNATQSELALIHAALGKMLEAGTLQPVVHQQLPLAKAAEAHRAVIEDASLGKIVLVP